MDVQHPDSKIFVHPTSVGKESDFHDGILILIDDAKKIVDSLTKEVPKLDNVVKQYYLQSLRACQEGLYIASVICLGAASERAVNCLAEAVINHDPKYKNDIEQLRYISKVIDYLSDKIREIFGSITDNQFMNELREKLKGIGHIYRRNRNEAGHPDAIPMDIARDEQENYLNSFRRYAITVFKAIDML